MKNYWLLAPLAIALVLPLTPAPAQKRKNMPRCVAHRGRSNHTFAVRIKVKPAYGKQWSFDEAPAVVAQQFLDGLNNNSYDLRFKEPNGDYPDFDVTITLLETHEGTRQDEASFVVEGPYEDADNTDVTHDAGVVLEDKSGEAPFTSWQDAIDHLSAKLTNWFHTGWTGNTPCVRGDGSVRPS